MSEEQLEQNDGSWSGLKKTIVGTLGTVVAGGGVWLSTLLFGGHDEKQEQPVQQAAPVINLNVANNNTQSQAAPAKTVIIKEKSEPTKQAEPAPKPKPFSEDPKW